LQGNYEEQPPSKNDVEDSDERQNRRELQRFYRCINENVIDRLILEDYATDWNLKISNVIVVLSASRSGSSLIYNALADSGKVAAPAGEHEPWLLLSQNKFPFTQSDRISDGISQQDLLLSLLRNDLLIRDQHFELAAPISPLINRKYLRNQAINTYYYIPDQDGRNWPVLSRFEWDEINHITLKSPKKPLPISLDQFGNHEYALPLENPPFISQPFARLASNEELRNLPLLFKSPSDSYRSGFYEQLFPNAAINYLHLTRGFAQTTNGLMDGWLSGDADFISNPVGLIKELSIAGYSNDPFSRVYWCFDLFPNWELLTESTIAEVCVEQWLSAHTSILNHFKSPSRLSFEQFYERPENFYLKLSDITGIDTTGFDWRKPIMSTAPPAQQRWLKRSYLFLNLGKFLPAGLIKKIREMQKELNYSMDAETWN